MRPLTAREKWLLGLCVGVIFFVVNAFAARSVLKVLRGSDATLTTLENEIADQEMWANEMPKAQARESWLSENMPQLESASMLGKLHGELLQSLQDDLFERKLKIEKQSMQDIVTETFYTEVAVRLTVRGDEKKVFEWLTSLQSPEKFQVIKAIELEHDTKSKEPEPQAVCQITIARWYAPAGEENPEAEESEKKETVSEEPAT